MSRGANSTTVVTTPSAVQRPGGLQPEETATDDDPAQVASGGRADGQHVLAERATSSRVR